MSMKLEKTAVKSERSSRGCEVSSEAIIGAKKCCKGIGISMHVRRPGSARQLEIGALEFRLRIFDFLSP